nr:hypothetical protein K-LCC10_0415 [Kaumoebavirus]
MTKDEKRDISTLKYRFIYHKMWVNAKKTNCYYRRKKKFETTFLADGGRQLLQLIKESKDVNPLWEFPKGRLDVREPNTECAIREFFEESGYTYDKYHLHYEIRPIAEISNYKKVSFISTYYLAEMPYENSVPMPEFLPSDVDEAKWISYKDCRLLDCEKLERNLTRVVEHLKDYGIKT